MEAEQIVAAAEAVREARIRVVFLQRGETPETTEVVCEAMPELKRLFGGKIRILLCLGEKSHDELALLRSRGADSYILKHETSDPELFRSLRNRSLQDRLACLRDLRSLGYMVGVGNIVGLPDIRSRTVLRQPAPCRVDPEQAGLRGPIT